MPYRLPNVLLCALAAWFVCSAAVAAVLTFDTSGQITGATNVIIGTKSFDVTFTDGSCPDLFSGCDENADFDFTTLPALTVIDAALALRDQVFLDGPGRNADSDPALTFGCGGGPCMTLIPSGLSPDPSDSLMRSGAFINIAGAGGDLIGLATYDISVDTSNPSLVVAPGLIDILDPTGTTSPLIRDVNYALFSPAAIPLPASALFLASGLLGLWATRRRRNA